MFMATLFSVFVSCKKQRKGHEVELMAIIQLDEAQSFTKTCMVNGTWVREHVTRSSSGGLSPSP